MSKPSNDRPNVIAFPPLILVITIALGFALQWLMPLGWIVRIDQTWRIGVGAIVAVIGALITIRGARALAHRGTNISPMLPTLAIATEGIFRWTRNPMYVGGTFLMIGIALIFALDWLLLLLVPSVLILHFGVVMREERYLERKFGDEYRQYKASVPRYLGPI
jgi:protein-S-isoprenylcysteine O-methyltransferase Ste14